MCHVIGTALPAQPAAGEVSGQLLLELLADKAAQALERAFRLLHLINPDENIRAAACALASGERAGHAHALEFLATLALDLQTETRELLRLATDALEQGARVEQARKHMEFVPDRYPKVLSHLVNDADGVLASIAQYHTHRAAIDFGAGSST